MEWYSGELVSCIQKVKQDKTLLLVFLKDDSDLSNKIQAALDIDPITSICKDAVCLKLESASTPFTQFSSVYEVPSVPCIHLILPAGSILSVKAAKFEEDQLIEWLNDQTNAFRAITEVNAEPVPIIPTPIHEASTSLVTSVPQVKTEPMEGDTMPTEGTSDNTLKERVKLAKQKLEEKKREKMVKEFQDTHESEINRRNIGKKMSDFKERQREQDIKEQLEERRRCQAEDKAARARVLQQIELDRKDLFEATTPTPPARASPVPLLPPRSAISANETRLQLRLPDGAIITATFSSEATLVGEVRQLISQKVFPSIDIDADFALSPPLADSIRHAFEPIVSRGYTFKQMIPPRRFSADEEAQTLRELDLLPSAVLVLISTSSASDSISPFANKSILGYSQDLLSQLVNVLTSGLHASVNFVFGLGQSVWGIVTGAGGRSGRAVGRSETASVLDENEEEPRVSRPNSHESSETKAYRRQGKITRLSHMPDDTDEEARWNGNSTTQM